MAKKKVTVICGASIVTSTIIADKLKQIFDEKNIEVEISKGLTSDADKLAQNADVIVTTAFLHTDYGIPVVNGVSFLTGVDVEKTIQQVLAGGYHTIFITSEGRCFVCGYNDFGQLGLGNKENMSVPTELPLDFLDANKGETIQQVVAGECHTILFTSEGRCLFGGTITLAN